MFTFRKVRSTSRLLPAVRALAAVSHTRRCRSRQSRAVGDAVAIASTRFQRPARRRARSVRITDGSRSLAGSWMSASKSALLLLQSLRQVANFLLNPTTAGHAAFAVCHIGKAPAISGWDPSEYRYVKFGAVRRAVSDLPSRLARAILLDPCEALRSQALAAGKSWPLLNCRAPPSTIHQMLLLTSTASASSAADPKAVCACSGRTIDPDFAEQARRLAVSVTDDVPAQALTRQASKQSSALDISHDSCARSSQSPQVGGVDQVPRLLGPGTERPQ